MDNAISKTINVPVELTFTDLKSIYQEAYRLGLKACTTFRPNPVTRAVLFAPAVAESASHCCDIEREDDERGPLEPVG